MTSFELRYDSGDVLGLLFQGPIMREFFHGWRRKMGCLALIVACALCGAWARSYSAFDQIRFRTGAYRHDLTLQHARITWICRKSDSTPNDWKASFTTGTTAKLARQIYQMERYKLLQMDLQEQSPREPTGVDIPYWSLVLPLTVLSAALILWKPRKKLQPDSGPSISN